MYPTPSRRRVTLAAGGLITASLITAGCTLELGSDRAAARHIAERIERSVERRADDTDVATTEIATITEAIDIVFAAADLDNDGHDDDGEFEIRVADATACIVTRDDRATFEVEPC